MKRIFVLVLLSLSLNAHAAMMYPTGPDDQMTPGSLCTSPTEYRYAEHIAYCARDVDSTTKNQVISLYDQRLGFKITTMNRQDFKIDHLIPLCAGGSNDPSNLWPQYKTVYQITDPLEQTACDLMKQGRLKQKDAIAQLLFAKHNLDQAPAVLQRMMQLGR